MSVGAANSATYQPEAWWVTPVRLIWLLTAIAGLILLVPELHAAYAIAKQVCQSDSLLNCSNGQITARAIRAFHDSGISLDAYAGYYIALQLITDLVAYVVAIALMVRRSADRMVIVSAFACLFVSISSVQAAGGVWATPSQVFYLISHISAGLFFFLFPTGRFVPRWTALLAAGYVAINFLPSTAGWAIALYAVSLISIIAIQIYRYRWVSTLVQRQQTKLVILGIGTFIGIFVVALAVAILDAGLDTQPIAYLLIQGAISLAALPILLSVGFAVLRYRLWDVDLLINRSLVYLALTVSLAGVYIGSVIGLQALFRVITGQESQLAIAISTLLIAIVFNPLRHRIQDLIARAFYRRRYNTGQVLAAFGATCRDETDLARLQGKLMRVVEETMQPEHVSLWLRP